MGAIVDAVAVSAPVQGEQPSSTTLAVRAATEALSRGSRAADPVELLVNAGPFRDRSVYEPASATLVQRGIGERAARGSRLLAFDVLNGACGLLTAAQVVDGFLATGGARTGLVVTSDVEPDPGRSEGFAYLPLGAALLLRPGAADEGFQAFDQQTYPQYAGLHDAVVEWAPGGHVLRVREDPSYAARALECAADAVLRFLDKQGRDPAELDLVVGWPFPDELPGVLRERVGLLDDQVLDLTALPEVPRQPMYSAGMGLALDRARTTARYRDARLVLLCTVGAGITVVTALYRKKPGEL